MHTSNLPTSRLSLPSLDAPDSPHGHSLFYNHMKHVALVSKCLCRLPVAREGGCVPRQQMGARRGPMSCSGSHGTGAEAGLWEEKPRCWPQSSGDRDKGRDTAEPPAPLRQGRGPRGERPPDSHREELCVPRSTQMTSPFFHSRGTRAARTEHRCPHPSPAGLTSTRSAQPIAGC